MKPSVSTAAVVLVITGHAAASHDSMKSVSNIFEDTSVIKQEASPSAGPDSIAPVLLNTTSENERTIATQTPEVNLDISSDPALRFWFHKREDADDEVDRYMLDKTCGWWCIRRLTRTCAMECRNEGSKKPKCYKECQRLRLWRQRLWSSGAPVSWTYAVEMFKQMKRADIFFDIDDMPIKKRSLDHDGEGASEIDMVDDSEIVDHASTTVSEPTITPAPAASTQTRRLVSKRDRAAVESALTQLQQDNIATLRSYFSQIKAGNTDTASLELSYTYEWQYGHPHIETRSTYTSSESPTTTEVNWTPEQERAAEAWLGEVFSCTSKLEPEIVMSLWSMFTVDMGPPTTTETETSSPSTTVLAIDPPSVTKELPSSAKVVQPPTMTPTMTPTPKVTSTPLRKFPLITRKDGQ